MSQRNSAAPPHAGGLPVLGVLRTLLRDPLPCLQRAGQRGTVVRLASRPRTYLVTDPDDIKHILQTNQRNYRRITPNQRSAAILGESLPLINDDAWLQRRRLMQPAFHRERIAALCATMTDTTATLLDAVGRAPSVDLRATTTRLLQTIIVKSMFGYTIGAASEPTGAALRATVEYLEYRSGSLIDLDALMLMHRRRAYQRSRQALDTFIYDLIATRRAGQQQHADLLALLLNALDADMGTVMTDSQVRDELLMIYLAGHETTATALTWTCYLLSRHPAVAQALADEIDTVLAGRTPVADDLSNMPFTRAVINEAMRLYPPVWLLLRQSRSADQVGGYTIPAGSRILISPFLSHRDHVRWSQPEAFAPQRFIDDPEAHRRADYLPFGIGPRQCIGNIFALTAAQLILIMIAQRFHIQLLNATEQPIAPTAGFTLAPSLPIFICFAPRG